MNEIKFYLELFIIIFTNLLLYSGIIYFLYLRVFKKQKSRFHNFKPFFASFIEGLDIKESQKEEENELK